MTSQVPPMRRIISPEKLNRLAREIETKIRMVQMLESLSFNYSKVPGYNKVRLANIQRRMFTGLKNLQRHGDFWTELKKKKTALNLNAIKNEIRLFRSLTPREMTTLSRFYSENYTGLSLGRRSQENANRYINALARKYKVPRGILEESEYIAKYKKVWNRNNPEVRAIRTLQRLRKKAIENKRLAVATALRQLPGNVSRMIISRKNLRLPSSPVSVGRLFN